MKGYRPDFYNKDPELHTIELLAWGAARDGFTLRDLRDEFNTEFMTYGDPEHEASERLRKLLKSGMIAVVSLGLLKTLFSTELINQKGFEHYENRLAKIQDTKKPGRKPRLYMATQTGIKYVESRKEDLAKIFEQKNVPKTPKEKKKS